VSAGLVAAGGSASGGVTWRARQSACLQASLQKRRRPDGVKALPQRAQVVIAVS